MLAELRRCPSLFATTADSCSVMARMNDDADKLLMCVATVSGVCYRDEFDEESLTKVKALLGEKFNWMCFFRVLRDAFNNGGVAVRAGEASAEVVCRTEADAAGNGHAIVFSVGRAEEDVLPLIVDGLIGLHQFRTHLRAKEQELEAMSEEGSQLRVKAEQLEKEVHVLRESSDRKRQMDAQNTQRIEELEKKIADVERTHQGPNGHATTGVSANAHNANGTKTGALKRGRIRQPLGEKECKFYDPDLLRLIKSRWMTKDDVHADALLKHVIIPYTRLELKKQILSFANKQQETIWKALDKIDKWDYNVFEIQTCMSGDDFASLSDQTRGGSLFITMYALLIKYGFLSTFNIDEQIALNWISNVEAGYHANPYHNSMHAADVLHITHYILSKGGMRERCRLSDVQVFAALFAAAIHDYSHPGVNNNFHIKTQSYSAILYNDRSVLENLHLFSVFELMKNPRINILESFSEDQRREIRETVIEMVLATDMGLHERYITQFRRRLGEHASFTERDDQNLALAIALKMADISNCGRPLDIYLKWSSKVSNEFYMQGDRERNLGLACSPFMDRLEPALAKGQVSFINYIIIPFFELVTSLLPNMRLAVEGAEICKTYWMQSGHD